MFSVEEVETIFEAVNDVHAFSVQLLASIEEMVEMASEMNEDKARYPQIGFCFEEVAEVSHMISLSMLSCLLYLYRVMNSLSLYTILNNIKRRSWHWRIY